MAGPQKVVHRKKQIPLRSRRRAQSSRLNLAKLSIDREIGWLNFNRRVLNEAEDGRNPLLERVRFLGISNSNLDEFFMKRVGGIKRQIAYGITTSDRLSKSPRKHLAEIRRFVVPMLQELGRIFESELKPELTKAGIRLLPWADLSARERNFVHQIYRKNIFPVLTPLSVDPGHPFPFISNLSTSLGVTLRTHSSSDLFFARIKIPRVLPQWIQVDPEKEKLHYINIIDIIQAHLEDLFPKMEVVNSMAFRLTRNADSEADAEDAEDLMEAIAEELRQRRFAEVIRLEHGPSPDPWILEFLCKELELQEEDIYELPSLLDYTSLNTIADLNLRHLKFSSHVPLTPPALTEDDVNIFDVIRREDLLIHNPFESYTNTVERFIRHASEDEKVLAIKMTLYRTGDHSPFIRSLTRAAENGKQVVCLIELKARFDEERNIYWATELENAGVHVVYGIVGLKTHAKTALVVRQEDEGVKCYCHIGTGNYNVSTSRSYTDLGLLTANEEISNDVVEFFNYLTGKSLRSDYRHLLIAPVNMFHHICNLIAREAEHARAGRPAQIIAKFNNFEENKIALELYRASQAGVEIDLIVRGFCCLRPGVPGVSERIRIRSIIGRFLEHSRLYYFRNGAEDPVDGEFFIGSADWMYRNLHARVEAMVPILSPRLKKKCWQILQMCLQDQRQSWIMNSDGNYFRKKVKSQGLHESLIRLTEFNFRDPTTVETND